MKNIVKSVAIVTFFGIATKALGLLIKIYISRVIGAEALGFFQIASSVFLLFCALVTSGFPLVISRRVAKNPDQEPALVSSGMFICLIVSGVLCLLIVFFPSALLLLLKQQKSILVLFTLLPALISTALYTPFRGAFWGRKDFFTISFVEFLEQIIRFVSCLILFNIGVSVFSGEQIVGIATSIACLLSTIYAVIYYFFKKGKLYPAPSLISPLLKESSPIAIIRIGTSVVSMLIAIILPSRMVSSGASLSDAIANFGVVSGMVLPLLTISGIIIGSIAVILVPELNSDTQKISTNTKRKIDSSISVSILLSLVLFPTFLGIGDQIGLFLFQNTLAGELLSAGSFLLLPLGLSQITTSIMNALGYEKRTLLYYIFGTIFLLFSIFFLTPVVGIYSILIGMGGMSIITTILNFFFLRDYLSFAPIKTLFISSLICIPCLMLSVFVENIMSFFFTSFFAIAVSCIVSVASFGILCICFNLIDITAVLPVKRTRKTLGTQQV